MANTVSKIRGQEQASGYPHPEGLLGDSMIKYGHDLGGASGLGETFLSSYLIYGLFWQIKFSFCLHVDSTAFKGHIEY